MLLVWAFLFLFFNPVTSQTDAYESYAGSEFNFTGAENLKVSSRRISWKSAISVRDDEILMIDENGTKILEYNKNGVKEVFSGNIEMNFIAYVNQIVDGIQSKLIVSTSDCLLSIDGNFETFRRLLGSCNGVTLTQAATSSRFRQRNRAIRQITENLHNITALAFYNSTIYLKFLEHPQFVAVSATSEDVQNVIMPEIIHPTNRTSDHKVLTGPLMMDVGDEYLFFWSFYHNEHWFGKVELGLKTPPKNAFRLSYLFSDNKPGFGAYQLTGHDNWAVVGFKYWRYHLVFVLIQNGETETKVFALDIDRRILYETCDPKETCLFPNVAGGLPVGEQGGITKLRRNVLAIRNHQGEPKLDIMCSLKSTNNAPVVNGVTATYALNLSSESEFEYTGVVAGKVQGRVFQIHWPLDRHLGSSSFEVCYGHGIAGDCYIRRNISTIRNRWKSKVTLEEHYINVYAKSTFQAYPSFIATTHVSKHGLFRSKRKLTMIYRRQLHKFGAPFGFGAEGFLYFSQNLMLNAEPVQKFIFRCIGGKSVQGGNCPEVNILASLARFEGAEAGFWSRRIINGILTSPSGSEKLSKAASKTARPYRINMLEKGFSAKDTYKFTVTLKSVNLEETFNFTDLRNRDEVRFYKAVTSINAFLQSPNEFHVRIVNPAWSPQVSSVYPHFSIRKGSEHRSVGLTQVNHITVGEYTTTKNFTFTLEDSYIPYFTGSSIEGNLRFGTSQYDLYIKLSIEAFPAPTLPTTSTETTTEMSTLPVEVTVDEKELDANLWLEILLAVASFCLIVVVINAILFYLGVLCYRHRKRNKTRTVVKEAGKLYHDSIHDYMAKDIYRLPVVARVSAAVAGGVLEDDTVRVKQRHKKVSRGIEANMPKSPSRTASPTLALATTTVVGSDNIHKAKFTGNRLGVTELYGLQDKP